MLSRFEASILCVSAHTSQASVLPRADGGGRNRNLRPKNTEFP